MDNLKQHIFENLEPLRGQLPVNKLRIIAGNIAFLIKCRKGVEIRPKDVLITIIDTSSNYSQPVIDGREVKVWVHNVGPYHLQQFKSVLVARVRTGHDLFQRLEEVVNRQIAQTRE